jgi:hypothetical protein
MIAMAKWIRDRTPAPAGHTPPLEGELKEAYQRGRRDERARRRRSPLAMLAVSLTALAGAGILAVSAWQGSFMQGGAVVDRQIATAADTAEPKIQEAAQDARSALREAGQKAKTRAQDLVGG